MKVYVPADPRRPETAGIRDGSGIVGWPDDESRLTVIIFYEGNIYNAANIRTWADKVKHAADRAVSRYPTSAMRCVPLRSLVPVAEINEELDHLVVTDPDALKWWLGTEDLSGAVRFSRF